MDYRSAKKLHNEDEVINKETGRSLYVVKIYIHNKDVYILCNDGEWYHHRAVK